MIRITALAFTGLIALSVANPSKELSETKSIPPTPVTYSSQKIQAAILLDVSGSMNGLIEQAKAQLWNMVSVMGRAKCQDGQPQIEIALYEYGRSSNNVRDGYIKQISPFTTDLDKLSGELFKLNTNGGDEYCGQVIYTSLKELKWDTARNNYKVIFIAGNEDFLQGSVTYTKACEEARKKGVIVNTIYCGSREQGIREHWNLSGECGNGSFTNIDHNAQHFDIPTPYDTVLLALNNKLNQTYIPYGSLGAEAKMQQERVDKLNESVNPGVAVKRTVVKGKSSLYNNSSWDLVDAVAADSTLIAKVDLKTLPESLRNKSRSEINSNVKLKNQERSMVQQRIASINVEREKYITKEKAKKSGEKVSTLETEVEKIIRDQVARFNMDIE